MCRSRPCGKCNEQVRFTRHALGLFPRVNDWGSDLDLRTRPDWLSTGIELEYLRVEPCWPLDGSRASNPCPGAKAGFAVFAVPRACSKILRMWWAAPRVVPRSPRRYCVPVPIVRIRGRPWRRERVRIHRACCHAGRECPAGVWACPRVTPHVSSNPVSCRGGIAVVNLDVEVPALSKGCSAATSGQRGYLVGCAR